MNGQADMTMSEGAYLKLFVVSASEELQESQLTL